MKRKAIAPREIGLMVLAGTGLLLAGCNRSRSVIGDWVTAGALSNNATAKFQFQSGGNWRSITDLNNGQLAMTGTYVYNAADKTLKMKTETVKLNGKAYPIKNKQEESFPVKWDSGDEFEYTNKQNIKIVLKRK